MSKKSKQTHALKKDSAPGELLPPVAAASILTGPGGTADIRVDVLEKLLAQFEPAHVPTLNEPALRQMAREGYFPPLRRRRVRLDPTIAGIIRCLLARAARRSERALPVLGSMDQAEGAGLLTKKFLQTLKNAGLAGFHDSGRIELDKLLPAIEAWLSGDNQRDKAELQLHGVASWDQYQKKFQALNEKLKYDENDQALIATATATQIGLAAQTLYFTQLDRLAVDLPGRLAGRSPAEIKPQLEAALRKIRTAVAAEYATRRDQARAQHTAQTANGGNGKNENVKGS